MSNRQRLAYLGCSLAIGVFSGFNNFSLSLWLGGFISSLTLISLLANTRGFLGSVVSPLAGGWSDRLWLGWLGRRRPFILGGGLAAAGLMAATPAIGRFSLNLPGLPAGFERSAAVILVIFIITIAFNLMDDIHKALLADLTREGPERNRLASFSVVTDMGGQVSILVIASLLTAWLAAGGLPDAAFWMAGGLVALGVGATVLGVREPAPATWAAELAVTNGARQAVPTSGASHRSGGFGEIWQRYRGALVFGLVIFCYWSGVNAVLPLISLYTRNILGASDVEAQYLPALLLLSTTIMAVPMGWLGTRLGKRRVIASGYLVMILAALTGLVISTTTEGAILFLLAGIGNAASMVLTIPLLADLVPPQHMGKAAGLLAAAGGIAAPISSLVAGGLADHYGERAIFLVMAVMVVLALGLLTAVRLPMAAAAATSDEAQLIGEEV